MPEEPIEQVASRLRATLDDEFEVANDVDDDEWRLDTIRGITVNEFNRSTHAHIDLQSPARTLARVAAYRAILDLWERAFAGPCGTGWVEHAIGNARDDCLEEVIRLLAGSSDGPRPVSPTG